jgi:hypothetical protein
MRRRNIACFGDMFPPMPFSVITLPSAGDRSEERCAADLAEGLQMFDRAVSASPTGARVVLVDKRSGEILADTAPR